MTTHSRRRTIAFLVALTALGSLTSCAPEPAPAASVPPVSSPSMTVEPVEEVEFEAPTPVIDLDCTDLADVDALSAGLAGEVTLQNELGLIDLDGDTGPSRYALEAAGGVECEWSNGEPARLGFASNPDYIGATVRVLPDAQADWSTFVQYGYDASGVGCSIDNPGVVCRADRLVGDRWVEVSLRNLDQDGYEAFASSVTDDAVAAVQAEPDVSSSWAIPADTVAIADGCDSLFSTAVGQKALAIDEPLFFDGIDGGYSLSAGAWHAVAAGPCPWVTSDGMGVGAVHQVLRGGQWAFEQDAPAGTPLTLTGLTSDDTALLDCPDPTAACTADLVVGRNWIRLGLSADQYTDRPVADKAGALTALAQAAVTTIRG